VAVVVGVLEGTRVGLTVAVQVAVGPVVGVSVAVAWTVEVLVAVAVSVAGTMRAPRVNRPAFQFSGDRRGESRAGLSSLAASAIPPLPVVSTPKARTARPMRTVNANKLDLLMRLPSPSGVPVAWLSSWTSPPGADA